MESQEVRTICMRDCPDACSLEVRVEAKAFVLAAGGSARSIGVPKIPGAIANTRMPNCANSRAAGNVKAVTPPLEEE